MQRTKLVRVSGIEFTPDTKAAVQALKKKAVKIGIPVKTRSGKKALPGPCSMPGREVRLESPDLRSLWSIAIPLGFTPWSRWPVRGDLDDLFHFAGPWQQVVDRLLAEGRGEIAWQSACCAAACDVGAWKGDRELERFVQAQLHRVGANPGAVDGVVGRRTAAALSSVGLAGGLETAAAELSGREGPTGSRPDPGGRWTGHVSIPGMTSIATYGKAASVRIPGGAALTIEGPGRVVIDFIPGDSG